MTNSFFCKSCKQENEFDEKIYFDNSSQNAINLEYSDGFYVNEEILIEEECIFCQEKNTIRIEGDLEVQEINRTLFTISDFKIKEER